MTEEFNLSLSEPKTLKDAIAIISNFIIEADIKVTKNNIELVAMDPANVAMVIFKMNNTAFAEYKVDKEQTIGINLSNLKQVLSRAKADDILKLKHQDSKLMISMIGKTTRDFSLRLIEIEEKEEKIPKLEFPIKISLDSSMFQNAIEDADLVAKSTSFIAKPNKFTISASGDSNEAKIEIPKDENTSIMLENKESAEAKYAIEYLEKMTNGAKLCERVTLQYNKEYPLKMTFKDEDFELIFILAPRVENE